MRSNDDTLSLMIEHEVDDVDYGVIIKRGDKTIHRFGYKYPEDDDLVPNEERIDSCLLTDLKSYIFIVMRIACKEITTCK